MLLEQQKAFRRAVFGDRTDDTKPPLIADEISPVERLAVYRNTAIGSLIGTLRAAYPVTERIVGRAFFAEAAGKFATSHPPTSPILSAFGGGFAEFLSTAPSSASVPYLSDVAQVEWARMEAQFAADATPINPVELAAFKGADAARLRLIAHPSCRIVRSTFPVVRIWQANQLEHDRVRKIDFEIGETALVIRPEGVVQMHALGPTEFQVLSALINGATLGEAGSSLSSDGAGELQTILALALRRGVFCEHRLE